MKKILLMIVITFGFNGTITADETECKTFDINCKTKKFWEETKKFQKKGAEDSKKQLGSAVDTIKKAPSKIKEKTK